MYKRKRRSNPPFLMQKIKRNEKDLIFFIKKGIPFSNLLIKKGEKDEYRCKRYRKTPRKISETNQ